MYNYTFYAGDIIFELIGLDNYNLFYPNGVDIFGYFY